MWWLQFLLRGVSDNNARKEANVVHVWHGEVARQSFLQALDYSKACSASQNVVDVQCDSSEGVIDPILRSLVSFKLFGLGLG